MLRVTDARGNYVDMTYELGLLTEIDSPVNEGSATNRRRVRMPRTTHYDFAGRLLQVDAEKSTNTFETRVEYLYTGFSQIRSLLRLKDAGAKSTDYSYDRLGRLLNVNDFKGDNTNLEHAPFCSNSTVKTPRGIHRKSVFDGLCRMTQIETQEERHLFDYDELDRLIRATVGERYAHTPPGQSRQGGRYAKTVLKFNTDYVYDENDRVTHIHYPNGDTVAYTYDDEGNVLSVTDVHGKTTSYTYYRDGRLKTVSYAGQTFSYSYDAAGRLSQIDYPTSTNVVVSFTKTDTTTGWDPNGQLLSVRYLKSGTEFQRFVYSYDNSGNRKTMDEVRTLSGTSVTVNWAYTYDGFNRLAQVYKNSNLVSVYTYDESDNRTPVDWPQSGEVWKMTFDIADRIEKREYKVGAGAFSDFETYTHDDDGNMTSRTLVASSTTVSYDWNSHNRLRQVRENGAHKESTSFDHGGIRRLKADSGGNTKYFSSAGMSLADTRPSGQVSFLQGHQLLGLEESGNLYYFVTDGLSSVRLVLDSSGNIQGELRYNEWGVPEAAVSPLSAPAAGLSGHSYTGGLGVRNDGASLGLYYAQQRYFDPHLGRWLTPDPIGFSGGPNLYAYADNDPTGRVDPVGNSPWVAWAIIGLAAEAYNHLSGYYEQLNNPANNQVRVNGLSLWEGGAYQRFPLEIQLFGASRFRFGRKCPQKTLTVGRWMSRAEYNTIIRTGRLPQRITGGNVVHVTCPPNSAGFTPKPGSMFVKFDVPSSQFRMNDPSKGWGRVFGPGSIEAKLAQRKGQPVPRELPEVTNIQILEEP